MSLAELRALAARLATIAPATSSAAPVRRLSRVWTREGITTYWEPGDFPFFVMVRREIYSARTLRNGTIQRHVGRWSGVQIVDYYPHRGVEPPQELVNEYRAAVALERDYGARLDQELGRQDLDREQEPARDLKRRGARERRAVDRKRPAVPGRRARA